MHAVLSARLITPAVTATVLNASRWPRPSGWRNKPLSFCRWDTSILVFTLPHELNRLILAHKKIPVVFCLKPSVKRYWSLANASPRNGGYHRRAAHLGPNPQRSFSSALSGSRRCSVPGSEPLDRCTKQLSVPSQGFEPGVSGKFLALLQQACDKEKIPSASIEIKAARQKSWVVYAKKPFGSPPTVLDYLGRYTHRVALSNDRILKVENGQKSL